LRLWESLAGEKVVRVVYIDESSHSAREPFAVVGGIILDPDKQWRVLAEALDELRQRRVPAEINTEDFFFHAAELYNGAKHRQTWDEEGRRQTLEELVMLPMKLRLPLVFGIQRRFEAPEITSNQASLSDHAVAFAYCLGGADWFMKTHTPPDQLAMIVAEQRKEARETLESAHAYLLTQRSTDVMGDDFPITRIKSAPSFSTKRVEPLLQIADACAWVLQRHLKGGRDAERFTQAMFGRFANPVSLGVLRSVIGDRVCFWWPSEIEWRDHNATFYSATAAAGHGKRQSWAVGKTDKPDAV
jgi:hypothetical protein